MAQKRAKKRASKRAVKKTPRRRVGKAPRQPAKKRAARATGTSVEKLIEQAQFVFRGTVRQRGAATLDQVPLTRDTLIVTIDEILDGPELLASFAGREITVQLPKGARAETGKRYVFYTNGWIFGQSIAVQCVGLSEDTGPQLQVAQSALGNAPARRIQERAQRAELVVTGRVTEVREARQSDAPITEHDPHWRQAVVAVDSMPAAASRRARKPRQVVFRFAASPDVHWAKAPKFTVGDAGVWMLGDKDKRQTAELRAAAGARQDEYVVVDPEDFFPAEFEEQITAIVSQ